MKTMYAPGSKPYSPTWTEMETLIVKTYYSKVEIGELGSMLPNRSTSAIVDKAKQLGLLPKITKPAMNEFSTTKTIEKLEAELNLKKAQAEYDAAQQRYKLFAERCRVEFSKVLKASNGETMANLFKQNAREFGKLNAAISNAARKLLERQIELGMVD